MKRVLVTGGAGIIGSHLVDALMNDGHSVTVVDNLSAGKAENIQHWFPKRSFAFEKRDLAEPVGRDLLENCSVVFHLAANADVRAGTANPRVHFDQNIQVTYNLLEGVRQSDVEDFIFTSTSTVYGDAEQIPTPEDYGPCRPISVYGASKLACESLISAYSNTYGFNAVIYRVANVMGSRSDHGVVHDLVDRKSTRLNSSHSQISYAVFCLKKKNDISSDTPRKAIRMWQAADTAYAVFNRYSSSSSLCSSVESSHASFTHITTRSLRLLSLL